jgi:hypothetical protein
MGKYMKKAILALAAASLLSGQAWGADLAVKAPPFQTYAYNGSGFFAGIYSEGGGGPVTATVPGVNSASLTTTTAAIGATVGYAFKGAANSPFTYTVEGDVCAKNFNGANAGFSLTGPLCAEARVMVFAPSTLVQQALSFLTLPNLFGNLASIVVPQGPAGSPVVTVTNSQWGIGGGAYFNDMTVAFNGVGAGKVWSVNPEAVFMIQDTLSNKAILRSFLKIDFESQTLLFGAGPNATVATKGIGARAGLSYLF